MSRLADLTENFLKKSEKGLIFCRVFKYEKTTITCACGEVIETSSTKSNIRVEICSKCHPFFTGKQKLVDTGGRVDRFKKRFGMKEDNQE